MAHSLPDGLPSGFCTSARVGATGERYVVLVVDDAPSVREMTAQLLTLCGYETLTASDGEAALAIVERERVDAVLTDLRMPGMGGTALRECLATRRVPVVLMSGDADRRGRRRPRGVRS
jgi:CheY-like chemotaxis protein